MEGNGRSRIYVIELERFLGGEVFIWLFFFDQKPCFFFVESSKWPSRMAAKQDMSETVASGNFPGDKKLKFFSIVELLKLFKASSLVLADLVEILALEIGGTLHR